MKRFRKPIPHRLIFYGWVLFLWIGMATPPLSAQILPGDARVSYRIEAQLFPAQKKLLAQETIVWKNTSSRPVNTLVFHLYPNAFRSEKTTYFTEAGYHRKSKEELSTLQFGGIDVTEMRVVEGEELTGKIRFISPDDGNRDDTTVAEVDLRNPVPPNGQIVLKLNFALTIPQIFSRSGQAGQYFFMGQWFPKLGVLDGAGRWHAHQYHLHSEFFAEFGHYQVALTLPEEFIVGASGTLINKTKNADGTYTHVFEEDHIHDFAWVACPFFKEIIERIALEGRTQEITIVLLLSHPRAKDRYLSALRYAMAFYAKHIYPYPYRKLTLVDPPFTGLRSGGMEYPTLITGAHLDLLPSSVRLTEWVTVHEFGHQYWYGIVGTDEAREAWLDEGVNTYFELEIMEGLFKDSPSLVNLPLLRLSVPEYHRQRAFAGTRLDRINQPSWHFMDGASYAAAVYSRTATLLWSLRNLVGRDRMLGFFKRYAETFRYKHPESSDFLALFNRHTGEDFTWAFERYVNGYETLDHAVYSIESTRIQDDLGLFQNEVVFVRNQGYFPVELQITLENGEHIHQSWNTPENRKEIRFTAPSPIAEARIDPDFKVPLDENRLNNLKRRIPSRKGISRLIAGAGLMFQHLLSLLVL